MHEFLHDRIHPRKTLCGHRAAIVEYAGGGEGVGRDDGLRLDEGGDVRGQLADLQARYDRAQGVRLPFVQQLQQPPR